MIDRLTIALAQIDPVVGDVEGNASLILEARREAAKVGAHVVIYSELILSGYPPEDLVLQPFFQKKIMETVENLASSTSDGGPALIIGAPWISDGDLYNAVLVLDNGQIAAVRLKHNLPNYGVFDEKRVFSIGPIPGPVNFRNLRLGIMVCEDMWTPEVTEYLEESGAEILVVLNGSPFDVSKGETRIQLAVARVTESGLPLIYVNQVGGQDELVFDGASFVLNANCSIAAQLPDWKSHLVVTHWSMLEDVWSCEVAPCHLLSEGLEAVYQAMVTGLRDYVRKNNFPGVIIGLSGGIDSALSAAVAVDALGSEKVYCVMMPSPYTHSNSLEDAGDVANFLGVRLDTIEIESAMKAHGALLEFLDHDAKCKTTTMKENIQSRNRALILMSLSNSLGFMVLTTGNKSEMSVGYATIYGDMCGGYSVLKDVYKTDVFRLAHWRNKTIMDNFLGPKGPVIPGRVISKPPTAELKPNQLDQDTLPPYEDLDDILWCLVEGEIGVKEIVDRGHSLNLIQRVWRMLIAAEYKRRQAPPGVKITKRAFGRDRRYPITNAFKKISS